MICQTYSDMLLLQFLFFLFLMLDLVIDKTGATLETSDWMPFLENAVSENQQSAWLWSC